MPTKTNMTQYEDQAHAQGYQYVMGVDEVGRGCIAGPLVCAGVIFPVGYCNPDIRDSKQLSACQRERLVEVIHRDCLGYQIVCLEPEIVDQLNPKKASQLGMVRCVQECSLAPDYVLVDFEPLNLSIPSISLVKGDQKSVSIAAASILAKVYRDHLMDEMDPLYPEYHFKSNKGYLTAAHQAAIVTFGPIAKVHRFSYKPIKK